MPAAPGTSDGRFIASHQRVAKVRRFLYSQERHGEHTASTPSFAIRRAYKAAAAARLAGVNQARIQGMLAAEPPVAPMPRSLINPRLRRP
jgi:hypothetical protein